MILQAIRTVVDGNHLSFDHAKGAMAQIMAGEATPAQIGALLTGLRMKGESIDEITGCAAAMRESGARLHHEGEVLEIVGTGGDGAFTFNISTVSAFVIAAAGVPVAKHGNRSVSSRCGAADVLEALGARIDLTPQQSEQVLRRSGMCFLFAPVYHPSMRHAAPVRRELGMRTIFNILGPMANPAGAELQLLGVYDERLVEPLARVLGRLGVRRAMVVHGADGLDEISAAAPTRVCEVRDGQLAHATLDPRELGFALCAPGDLVGGDAADNAAIARRILCGERGAKRDIVLLNAGACLYLAGRAGSLGEGAALAASTLDNGTAIATLEAFVRVTQEVA